MAEAQEAARNARHEDPKPSAPLCWGLGGQRYPATHAADTIQRLRALLPTFPKLQVELQLSAVRAALPAPPRFSSEIPMDLKKIWLLAIGHLSCDINSHALPALLPYLAAAHDFE